MLVSMSREADGIRMPPAIIYLFQVGGFADGGHGEGSGGWSERWGCRGEKRLERGVDDRGQRVRERSGKTERKDRRE